MKYSFCTLSNWLSVGAVLLGLLPHTAFSDSFTFDITKLPSTLIALGATDRAYVGSFPKKPHNEIILERAQKHCLLLGFDKYTDYETSDLDIDSITPSNPFVIFPNESELTVQNYIPSFPYKFMKYGYSKTQSGVSAATQIFASSALMLNTFNQYYHAQSIANTDPESSKSKMTNAMILGTTSALWTTAAIQASKTFYRALTDQEVPRGQVVYTGSSSVHSLKFSRLTCSFNQDSVLPKIRPVLKALLEAGTANEIQQILDLPNAKILISPTESIKYLNDDLHAFWTELLKFDMSAIDNLLVLFSEIPLEKEFYSRFSDQTPPSEQLAERLRKAKEQLTFPVLRDWADPRQAIALRALPENCEICAGANIQSPATVMGIADCDCIAYCDDCARDQFRSARNQRHELARCPNCKRTARTEFFKAVSELNESEISEFDRKQLENLLGSLSNWRFCRGEDCLNGVVSSHPDVTDHTCTVCGHRSCLECGNQHPDSQCDGRVKDAETIALILEKGMRARPNPAPTDPMDPHFEDGRFRACPHCGKIVEWQDGCTSVKCKACNQKFDWVWGLNKPLLERLKPAQYNGEQKYKLNPDVQPHF